LKCGLKVTERIRGAFCDDVLYKFTFTFTLKVVPFESLGAVSYSPSIVTMAVSLAISETFSIKEWPDFEIWVWGRSRSLKMAQFDRPCVTFY